jgi:hypothetical protein
MTIHTTEHAGLDADPWEANAAEILHLRGELARTLITAAEAAIRAKQILEELTSNHVYDVELVEGTAGTDIASLLTTSGRDLRAALAMLRAIPD